MAWRKDFSCITMIGNGHFGTVFKAFDNKGSAVAIKEISDIDDKSVYYEIIILRAVRHDNIVKYLGHYIYGNNLALVMEYADQGTMMTFRENRRFEESEFSMWLMLHQLSDALAYLHQKGVMHRDLKPDNILCFSTNEMFHFKLGDFGLAKLMNSDVQHKHYTAKYHGFHNYMAPEVLSGEDYTFSADMWSVGAISYFWFIDAHLFKDPNDVLEWEGKDGMLPGLRKELRGVVAGLLLNPIENNQLGRLKANDILKIISKGGYLRNGME